MIDIFLQQSRICVKVDQYHPHFHSVYVMVRSLLSAYEISHCTWSVSYADIVLLRNRLDSMGLVDGRSVSQAAFERISWIHATHVQNAEIKKGANNRHVEQLLQGKLKSVPYEDQYTAIAYAYNNRRVGIFDDMGVGKSLEALGAIVAHGQVVQKTLIVCPYTVQLGFIRQVKIHTHLKAVGVPNGRARAAGFIRENLDNPSWDIMMVHPENLVSSTKASWAGEVLKILREFKWDMIIVDEAHMYKNLDAKRTKCVLSLLQDSKDRVGKPPRVILLTGTPVSENPTNAYMALKVLSSDFLPHESRFESHFVLKKEVSYVKKGSAANSRKTKPLVKKVVGYKNLDELKALLESVSIRRTKADMEGFPEKITMIRDVVLSGAQLSLYRKISEEVLSRMGQNEEVDVEQFMEDTSRGMRLRMALNHPSILEEAGDSAKYVECDFLLEEILANPLSKVIIWTEYRKGVDLLHARYDAQYGAVKIYGGVDNKKLAEIEEAFVRNDGPRVAVCIPSKAGTGVDFLARARTSIYIDRPYSLILFNQSGDRIHRRVTASVNRTELDEIRSQPATLIFLDVVGSIDEGVRDRLAEKMDMATALTTSNDTLMKMGRSDLIQYLSM